MVLLVAGGCAAHRDGAARENIGESRAVRVIALRLKPGEDLKQRLVAIAKERRLHAGFVMSAVGSLKRAAIRLADQPNATRFEGKFEIVALSGTISEEGCHLHIALSDSTGKTIGGHLVDGCEIYTTAEIVLGEAEGLRFSREVDPGTGYRELIIGR
jgi:predicted DNA-binding protein with PD1-like motif